MYFGRGPGVAIKYVEGRFVNIGDRDGHERITGRNRYEGLAASTSSDNFATRSPGRHDQQLNLVLEQVIARNRTGFFFRRFVYGTYRGFCTGTGAHKQKHDAFLAAYRAQDWDKARDLIQRCRQSDAQNLDKLYDVYEARIAEFSSHPAVPDWDGVYVALDK